MSRFNGKVALITGGALGIGGATARRLAMEGATVIIADFNPDSATDNVKSIIEAGGIASAIDVDVSVPNDIKSMIEHVNEKWHKLDILVQNAFSVIGGESRIHGSAEEVSEEDWDWGMAVLSKAIYLGAKHAVPLMRRSGGGVIINLASVHSVLQEPGMLVYEAGKAAVKGMTRQMAVEYGPDNIRVNAIGPGHILSEGIQENLWKKNPDGLKFFADQYPLRRVGKLEDIAGAIAFLCSEDAAFITGHTLMVDGGLTIQLQEKFATRIAQYTQSHPELDP